MYRICTTILVLACKFLPLTRSYRTGAAFLLCSWALSAQIQPGQLPLVSESEPDFPLATPVSAVQGQAEPLSFKGKTNYFLKSAFSAETLGRVGLTTSIGQIAGVSEDWGTGGASYGRRLRNNYTRHLVSSGVRYGIGAARGEDPRFYRSGKNGFLARTGFVFSRTFVVQMDDGSKSVALGRLAGSFTGNTLAEYMRPHTQDPWQTGLTRTAFGIGSDMGMRMIREFWPDIRRKFKR
jgi:hypothetical protein